MTPPKALPLFALLLLSALPSSAAEPDPPYRVPDLKAWSQVRKGLPVGDLEKLLGKPITKSGPNGDYQPSFLYSWTYGYAAKKSEIFPKALEFMVRVEMGKVWSREDPFGGVEISLDGSPSMPRHMLPADGTTFDHYPRIMDFRWYAASGDYPMKYEIEIDVQHPSGEWKQEKTPRETNVPYYSYIHGGASAGRWRIRAVNARGKSEWSEYFFFNFKR